MVVRYGHRRLVAAGLLLTAAALFPAGVRAAAVSTPQLESFVLETPGVIAAASPVTFSYAATDDGAVTSVVFHVTDPLGHDRAITGDGTGPATGVVANDWPTGPYRLDSVVLTDDTANVATYFFDGIILTSPADADAPAAHALDFSAGGFSVDSGAPARLKPPLRGLVDRFAIAPELWRPTVNARVLRVDWAELQPTQAGPIAPDNPIDAALYAARQINSRQPDLGLTVKLRIYAGRGAPDWAKSLGGDPIDIVEPVDDVASTIGRFWTPDLKLAYGELMTKLAERYDHVPELREVTVSGCMTTYAEPLLRGAASDFTRSQLLAAGFNVADDHACQRGAIDAHQVWSTTHSSLAVNPYQQINADGSWRVDEQFTEDLLDYCVTSLGARCTMENNSIRDANLGSDYRAMYAHMQASGAPITFQTAVLRKVGSLCATLDWARSVGAEAVELPTSEPNEESDNYARFNFESVRAYDRALEQLLPADTTPPASPRGVHVEAPSRTTLTVDWERASDDIAVGCYLVYRDGVKVGAKEAPPFVDTELAPGRTYTYTVVALDGAGNTSVRSLPARAMTEPAPTPAWIQNDAVTVSYGGWSGIADPASSGGTRRTSGLANSTAQVGFNGRSITWLTRKGPAQGRATVTIDGINKGTVDLYASSLQAQAPVTFGNLASRSHQMVIKVVGTANAASTGTAVDVDAFVAGGNTMQDNGGQISFDGWRRSSASAASGGSYHWNAAANRTASFSFVGTRVDWVTATGPFGKATVTIDGVAKGTVDLYAKTTAWRVVKSFAGLARGPHTVVVKALGTKHASSPSTRVVVDAFVVTP